MKCYSQLPSEYFNIFVCFLFSLVNNYLFCYWFFSFIYHFTPQVLTQNYKFSCNMFQYFGYLLSLFFSEILCWHVPTSMVWPGCSLTWFTSQFSSPSSARDPLCLFSSVGSCFQNTIYSFLLLYSLVLMEGTPKSSLGKSAWPTFFDTFHSQLTVA